ncbi:cytidylyltransferase domain-containing protein [Chitinophaga sp. GCM10012297]|uniref:Glycosyltransferase family protein n=1 Tax=Chitinophaga chungangae TaxID=2821488 RepID=A0ABS3YF39_9BACT|nr:glycosyltransferase family protein [Chitinophaga chungangae]MBO9153288.1 glycosyltransferase family protein [Chitinophaga chungangae]
MMRVVAITQARIGSSRLPGKILREISGRSLLEIHLQRIAGAATVGKLIVATTKEPGIEPALRVAEKLGVEYFQGSTSDVLDRFYQSVKNIRPEYVIRLTADCPLIDPQVIDKVVRYTLEHQLDYCSNTLEENYPDGQDVEVFRFSTLEKAWNEAALPSDREHVTPFIRKNSDFMGGKMFKAANFNDGVQLGGLRMTVDEQRDFDVIAALVAELGTDASMEAYAELLLSNPAIRAINNEIKRNEGYQKSLENDE